jgi:tetratricopeptide (TPR) repeat protein
MPTIDQLLKDAYSNWDDAAVLARTGKELHDRNRLDHSKAVLGRALELDPQNKRSWAYLSYCHFRSFAGETGQEVLGKGIEATGADMLRAVRAAFTSDQEKRKELLKEIEGSTEALVRAELEAMKIWDGDVEALDRVRKIAADNPDDDWIRDVFLWSLMSAKSSGKIEGFDLREEGVPIATRKIEASPDIISGYWMKTTMLQLEKDWDALLETTGAALERIPDDETMLQFRGRAYKEKGDLDRAIQCFTRATGMKHSFVGARVDLGKAYEAQEKFDLAEEIFREIPKANPGYAPGPMSIALFLARRERWEEAEAAFLEAWPKLPEWFRGGLKQNPDAAPLLEREAIKKVVE